MEDFKEIVYFAVSLIVAAFIITLVIALGNTTGQMAAIRNGELMTADNLRLARYYGAYDNQLVIGGDIIALIRENAVGDGTLDIYVDRDNSGASMNMNYSNRGNTLWRLSNLSQRIKADTIYRAILVYSGENPAIAVYTANPTGDVTGVKFTRN